MRALASFASSESGRLHARIAERWGLDPAAFLEPEDDVLAANLRVAFVVALGRDESPDPHTEMVERARRGGEKVRRALA